MSPKSGSQEAAIIPLENHRNEAISPGLRSLFLQTAGFRERCDFLLSPTRFDQLQIPGVSHGEMVINSGRDLASAILGRKIKFTGREVMMELADKLGFP